MKREQKTKKHDFWNDADDSMKQLFFNHEIIDVYKEEEQCASLSDEENKMNFL